MTVPNSNDIEIQLAFYSFKGGSMLQFMGHKNFGSDCLQDIGFYKVEHVIKHGRIYNIGEYVGCSDIM